MKLIKVTKKEQDAIFEAWGYLNNTLEACTGNKKQLKPLQYTMTTLIELHKKIKNS